ncbi:MAG: PUR family DNA/RNA-binding protein [Candidatus Bostrichicola ureolyticus]|nr:MAG: PUR family DNA/RNA-binding protein [Candidatus Bostrichicola ureolyticus]
MDEKSKIKHMVYSNVLKSGNRTYFFDVKETRAGDYYLTINESKRFFSENGEIIFKKNKIYLYKEDFQEFKEILNNVIEFILEKKGKEVISERHNKNFVSQKDKDQPNK